MDLPRRVDKPWGHELWYALTDRYAGKMLHVDAGHRLPLQFHHHKDESSYLLSGRLKLITGTSAEELTDLEIGPGHTWRTEAGQIHTIEAIENSVVLEVSTPEVDRRAPVGRLRARGHQRPLSRARRSGSLLPPASDRGGRCGRPAAAVPAERGRRRGVAGHAHGAASDR